MTKAKELPSWEYLNELFLYDYKTGVIIWKKNKARAAKGSLAGCWHNKGYKHVQVNGKKILLHRLAFFLHYKIQPNVIDHINHNRSDNSIKNLRSVTNAENSWNSQLRKNNTSGFKGVSWQPSVKKWQAQINTNKKITYLGVFDFPKDAHAAYLKEVTARRGVMYAVRT